MASSGSSSSAMFPQPPPPEARADRDPPPRIGKYDHIAPFPIHISPIDGPQTALDWTNAISRHPILKAKDSQATNPAQLAALWEKKREILETYLWPSLDRWYQGEWPVGAMHDILDLYRLAFGKPGRMACVDGVHEDGMWAELLDSSPWYNWIEFRDLRFERSRDEEGKLRFSSQGEEIWRLKPPQATKTGAAEEAFIDRWNAVCNSRPVRRYPNGIAHSPRLGNAIKTSPNGNHHPAPNPHPDLVAGAAPAALPTAPTRPPVIPSRIRPRRPAPYALPASRRAGGKGKEPATESSEEDPDETSSEEDPDKTSSKAP